MNEQNGTKYSNYDQLNNKLLLLNDPNNERVILNVGGLKYETYRSTLKKYPDTLLGMLFQDKNKQFLEAMNGNEYFIDRNGYAFRYILEYYRNGEIYWPNENSDENSHSFTTVSRRELRAELDFFQIPVDISINAPLNQFVSNETLSDKLDGFITALKSSIFEAEFNFRKSVNIQFHNNNIGGDISNVMYIVSPRIEKIVNRLRPYESCGYSILRLFGEKIKTHIYMTIPCIKCNVTKKSSPDSFIIDLILEEEFDVKVIEDNSKHLRSLDIMININIPGLKDSEGCTLILTEGRSSKEFASEDIKILGDGEWGLYPICGKFMNVRNASPSQTSQNEQPKRHLY
nr:2348_t:CDS:2 [Entrophospora candida]